MTKQKKKNERIEKQKNVETNDGVKEKMLID